MECSGKDYVEGTERGCFQRVGQVQGGDMGSNGLASSPTQVSAPCEKGKPPATTLLYMTSLCLD